MTNHSHYEIVPSILSADLARLGEEVNAVLQAGANRIHIDVMDNHYVPNLTFGPLICQALRKHGIAAPLDAHLMVTPTDDLIVQFAKAGAHTIYIHPEATQHLDRSLQLIRDQGCGVGLALNPATPLYVLKYILSKLDRILVMTVNPGFGGQAFIPEMLSKIHEVYNMIQLSHRSVVLEVDGGVNTENIANIAKHGAMAFVAGNAIFGSDDYQKAIITMRHALATVDPLQTVRRVD